jgi:hypothetical protein
MELTAPVARARPAEVAFGIALAGTSGAALIAHVFGPLRLSFTAPFVVLPAACVLSGLILFRSRLYERLHVFSNQLVGGATWGLLATFCYDAIRPLVVWIDQYDFNPYGAIPLFGSLATGLPKTDGVAIGVGWLYHFVNGIEFGMIFALLRPRGGILWGVTWAMALQGLMMLVYPKLIRIGLEDGGFLTAGLAGHAVWGVVLGWGLKRRAARA